MLFALQRVRFLVRKSSRRVRFSPDCLHGKDGFGTKSVHGGYGRVRVHLEVYTVGKVSGRKVYTVKNGRTVRTFRHKRPPAVRGFCSLVCTVGMRRCRKVYTVDTVASEAV